MIYRVLSAPCVYISSHNRNEQGPHGADDIGTRPDRTRPVHSIGTGLVQSIHITLHPVLGERCGDHKTVPSLASVSYSDPFQVSCCFSDLMTTKNVFMDPDLKDPPRSHIPTIGVEGPEPGVVISLTCQPGHVHTSCARNTSFPLTGVRQRDWM